MKILLCCIFFYSGIFAAQKNVYAPNGKKMQVYLENHQHGLLDDSGLVWLEKGYWLDGQSMMIKKCTSSIFDRNKPDCVSLKIPR